MSKRYTFNSYHLTKTLKLKDLDQIIVLKAVSRTSNRLLYQEDEDSYFFVYRFGSVVFFNVSLEKQHHILTVLRTLNPEKDRIVNSEDYSIEVASDLKTTVGFECATTDDLTLERIEILALVLAQSTTLEYFENVVDDILYKSGDIMGELEKTGRMSKSSRNIYKFIGSCMTTKQSLVSNLYLLDKPDETWDDQLLESLYRESYVMFELNERYKTVDYKLKMLQENLEIIAGYLNNKKANKLELWIVILIIAEIILFVMDLAR